MEIAAKIIVALVALEHLYILWLEMFAWTTRGPKVFGTKGVSPTYFEETKTLAANQGLYNGFLAAGLIWSLAIGDNLWSTYVALFFLGCVLVAGLYGAATASKRILYVQALPALVGLVLNGLRLL
jgi:putative membrane protein